MKEKDLHFYIERKYNINIAIWVLFLILSLISFVVDIISYILVLQLMSYIKLYMDLKFLKGYIKRHKFEYNFHEAKHICSICNKSFIEFNKTKLKCYSKKDLIIKEMLE